MTRKPAPSDGDKVIPFRVARSCPICGKPATRTSYPFCSTRCSDIDLNRWLSGAYAIPGSEDMPPDDDDDRSA